MPRKEGYDNIKFTVKSKCLLDHILLIIIAEPIEQNVHGNKGVYELVYFVKESKAIERFKKQA